MDDEERFRIPSRRVNDGELGKSNDLPPLSKGKSEKCTQQHTIFKSLEQRYGTISFIEGEVEKNSVHISDCFLSVMVLQYNIVKMKKVNDE